MALVRTGGLLGQVSGAIGNIVFARNRNGAYIRARSTPVTSTTEYALAAKARLTAATAAWQLLSAARKLAWGTWASTNPTLNRLGDTINLTGHAAFVASECRATSLTVGGIDDPPVTGPPEAVTSLSLTGDIGPGDVAAVFTPAPMGAGLNLAVWACVSDSAGINYIENYLRLIGRSGAAEASPFDIKAIVEARFGALAVGQILHVQCAVFSNVTKLLSGFLRANVTIIDTT